MRESPSIPLITALQDLGAKIRAYDPEGMEQSKPELSEICYCDGPYSCAESADALVIVTEWEQFRALGLDRLKRAMARPIIIDLRDRTWIPLRKHRPERAKWWRLGRTLQTRTPLPSSLLAFDFQSALLTRGGARANACAAAQVHPQTAPI